MRYVADFHIHSHYSLATSKELTPESLNYWAALKGIKIVATGDFTHPGWLKELREKLEPAEPGLYKLKAMYKNEIFKSSNLQIFKSFDEVRFLLTAEISNIYKKAGKTRKIHSVVFAPDFEAVAKIQRKLTSLDFNISSDGRPILGMDAKNLLELLLDTSPDIFYIPAHIWTPWFSVLGANSGYDSIKECYEDLSDNIYAVETGLSSDPPMNWLCSFLDKYTLVSNSDAHSPEKLGRNANILDTDISYKAITDALKTGNPEQCLGTIEMFPQEGKYHYAGHAKCGVCWNPSQTNDNKGICSVCGKKITNGVMNRVVELSDRKNPTDRPNRLPFYYAITLKEILSELTGVGESSKKLTAEFNLLIQKLGPELDILLNIPIKDIANSQFSTLNAQLFAEAIDRMRTGNVIIQHGFDGQYGKIKVFSDSELKSFGNNKLFKTDSSKLKTKKDKLSTNNEQRTTNPDRASILSAYKEKKEYAHITALNLSSEPANNEQRRANNEQRTTNNEQQITNNEQLSAINHLTGPALVIAGPGTGKTYILTNRIVKLIQENDVSPENILAVTFTNKAAGEIKERVNKQFEDLEIDRLIDLKSTNQQINISTNIMTFHAFGLSVLKEHYKLARRKKNFIIIDERERHSIIEKLTELSKKEVSDICKAISEIKQNRVEVDEELISVLKKYEAYMTEQNCFDIDDLIFYPVRIFEASPEILDSYRQIYQWILIDEYQDINLIQYQLVKALMPASESNLFAIGDANQAIYGFRGADVKFIRQFVIDYPLAKVYHLHQSYRCSGKILKASDRIIHDSTFAHSEGISVAQPDSSSLKGLSEGIKINLAHVKSGKSEAEFIVRTIENMMGGLRFFSMDSGIADGHEHDGSFILADFAILCRIGKQFDAIEKALNDHSIPFRSISENPFFKQEPIDNIIDFLKYSVNPDNTFIKAKLLKKHIIQSSDPHPDINRFREMTVSKAIDYIISLYFRNEKEKDESRIRQLIELSDDFGTDINAFIEFATIGIAPDAYRSGIENVSLMTLHAAKGLEFKCVFIAGCEEGLLPYSLFESQQADVEEEKRLLYVGMTRAKSHLFLSHADHRYLMGKEYSLPQSHFLENIEADLAKQIQADKSRKPKKDDSQLGLF